MNEINKNIKIFFIDLDGTALDIKKEGKHWMSDENVQAIKNARKEGKEIVISTGRMGAFATPYINLIKSEYAVTGNGAQVFRGKELLIEFKLSIRQSLLLLDVIKKHKLSFKLDDGIKLYGPPSFIAKKYAKKYGWVIVKSYIHDMHKEYYKFVIFGKTKNKMKKIKDEIISYVSNVAIVSSSGGWTLEVTNEMATKGHGNEFIWRKLNFEKSETAHVGDTMNDSTAVDHVGRLIVMKNARRELKQLSPWRGPSYKNAGLAKVLRGEYKKIGG